jgi:signal transduction histidine kinase
MGAADDSSSSADEDRAVALPVYLLGSGAPAVHARALAGVALRSAYDTAGDFLPLGPRLPGLVLLLPALTPADVLAVLRACSEAGGAWTPVLVEATGDGATAIPLDVGYRCPLELLARAWQQPENGDGVPLHAAQLAERVRMARHDINNPLAAALAETQLLLMDATDEETLRALTAIQTQLRRIRELLGSIPVPAPPRRAPAE